MEVDFIGPAIRSAKAATEAESSKDYSAALSFYMKSIDQFMIAIKHEKIPNRRKMMREKVLSLMNRAEQIKQALSSEESENGESSAATASPSVSPKVSRPVTEAESRQRQVDAYRSCIRMRSGLQFSDIPGLKDVKECLQECVILPLKFPQLFQEGRSPRRPILLHGAPGTGKTFLVRALAGEADCPFLSVSSSDLFSRYNAGVYGPADRLLEMVFAVGREEASENGACLLFFDEVDSFCDRNTSLCHFRQRLKGRLLQEFRSLQTSNVGRRLLVVLATNVPWKVDPEMIRACERVLYLPMPDLERRIGLLNACIGDTRCDATDEEKTQIAAECNGLTPADISIMVRNALMVRSSVFLTISGTGAKMPEGHTLHVREWSFPKST